MVVAGSEVTPSDTDIAGAARRALNLGMDKLQTELHQSILLLRVKKGSLPLEKQVEWRFQRQSALAAWKARSVASVHNQIVIGN